MQGISRLEQLVEELSEEERAKELKQEKKRQKRKNRRKNKCGLEEVKSTNLDEVMILLYIIRDFGLLQSGFQSNRLVSQALLHPDVGGCKGCSSHDDEEEEEEDLGYRRTASCSCPHDAKQGNDV